MEIGENMIYSNQKSKRNNGSVDGVMTDIKVRVNIDKHCYLAKRNITIRDFKK